MPADRTSGRWPTSARVAAVLLMVIGVANAIAGVTALVVAPGELLTGAAIGLAVAGLVSTVLGWLVWRRSRAALYVALGIFELLLLARVVTIGGTAGTEVVALVLLVVLVGLLGFATVQVRRAGRHGSRSSAAEDRVGQRPS